MTGIVAGHSRTQAVWGSSAQVDFAIRGLPFHLVQDNLSAHRFVNALIRFYGEERGKRIWEKFHYGRRCGRRRPAAFGLRPRRSLNMEHKAVSPIGI